MFWAVFKEKVTERKPHTMDEITFVLHAFMDIDANCNLFVTVRHSVRYHF